jgi:hypothetical protein
MQKNNVSNKSFNIKKATRKQKFSAAFLMLNDTNE